MAVFKIPVVFMIEADSIEDAQEAIEEWGADKDPDELPSGTEDVDYAPTCEHTEDHRVLYIPHDEDMSDDVLDSGPSEDDFNSADNSF